MLGLTAAIARNTFLESIRQPIFFVLIAASAVFQVFNLLLSAYSMGYTEDTEVHGDDKLLLDMGLATVFVCATLLAAFIATSVLAREIDNKTALTVISKPVGRPLFILGKYLGVVGAILLATLCMTLFFLFVIRHEVMSTVRDPVDQPVVVFAGLAVLLSLGVGIWGNFFYGWVFSSTAVTLLAPLLTLAYVVTLAFDKEWALQPLATDFKPQVTLACLAVLLSMTVLAAIAIAASTRLGQVMTIVVCAGAFILGLMSNYLVGRFAFDNEPVGRIVEVEPEFDDTTLAEPGDEAVVIIETPARAEFPPGSSFYYGPDPAGVRLAVPPHEPFPGDVDDPFALSDPAAPEALVVTRYEPLPRRFEIVNTGGLPVRRLPSEGDLVFTRPTDVNPAAVAAWAVVPNLQFFWLVDAITQGHDVPPRYVVLLLLYTGFQATGLLALATLLFQTRDVG